MVPMSLAYGCWATISTRRLRPGSIVLTDENGTPYNGETTDDEGLGVLPNGDFLFTSEGHPNAAEGEQ